MKRPVIVTDHALIRFIERVGGLDAEVLRTNLAASLARAISAADAIGVQELTVVADGNKYVVVNGRVITVLDGTMAAKRVKKRR